MSFKSLLKISPQVAKALKESRPVELISYFFNVKINVLINLMTRIASAMIANGGIIIDLVNHPTIICILALGVVSQERITSMQTRGSLIHRIRNMKKCLCRWLLILNLYCRYFKIVTFYYFCSKLINIGDCDKNESQMTIKKKENPGPSLKADITRELCYWLSYI